MANNLSISDLADSLEQLEEIAFRRIERQITYIELGRGYLDQLWFPAEPFLWCNGLSLLFLGRFLGPRGLKIGNYALPKGKLNGFCRGWSRSTN
jgi:hypothetical protein